MLESVRGRIRSRHSLLEGELRMSITELQNRSDELGKTVARHGQLMLRLENAFHLPAEEKEEAAPPSDGGTITYSERKQVRSPGAGWADLHSSSGAPNPSNGELRYD